MLKFFRKIRYRNTIIPLQIQRSCRFLVEIAACGHSKQLNKTNDKFFKTENPTLLYWFLSFMQRQVFIYVL